MAMDITIKKQLGYLIMGIWAAWGCAILAILLDLTVDPLWIAAIEGTWYAIDTFLYFFIRYFFNIEVQTPEQRLITILTELKTLVPKVDSEWYQQQKDIILKS